MWKRVVRKMVVQRRVARKMFGGLAVALFAGLALASAFAASAQSGNLSGAVAAIEADRPGIGARGLPPAPPAKDSTIFGGAIRKIDPV